MARERWSRRHARDPLPQRRVGQARVLPVRLSVLTLLAVLALAAPARAQQLEPPPITVGFVPAQMPPVVAGDAMIGQACGHVAEASGGRDGGAYMPMECGELIEFSAPQAMVELFVRVPSGSPVTVRACEPRRGVHRGRAPGG